MDKIAPSSARFLMVAFQNHAIIPNTIGDFRARAGINLSFTLDFT
jgi:hypothetical protein